jgi:vacuolar protein sorting-associated protein 16
LCTDEYLELLKDQEVLRTKYDNADVCCQTSSVAATIASVLRFAASNVREQHRLFADADKLAKKYRIAEKRVWHIKVIAFAESKQWSNLRILAESRSKSPIGFKPFAKAAIRGRLNSSEVLKYIEKVSIPIERYDLFCEAEQWHRALDEARSMKDIRRLLNVKTLSNSPELALLADQTIGALA